jgi:competence protein ComEC
VPITGFWVMPWGMLALVLMPLGLEELALEPMRWGIAAIIYIAREVASWPGAAALLPALPPIALPLMALGGLWLCLWQRRWRLLGLIPLLLVAILRLFVSPPDILASGDARVFGVRDRLTGHLMLSGSRRDRLIIDTWMRRAGDDESAEWPRQGTSRDGSLICDASGCILRQDGHVIALADSADALLEDCRNAELVLSRLPARRFCGASPAQVIDLLDLRLNGGYSIWVERAGFTIRTVRDDRGERPWTGTRPQPAAGPRAEPGTSSGRNAR